MYTAEVNEDRPRYSVNPLVVVFRIQIRDLESVSNFKFYRALHPSAEPSYALVHADEIIKHLLNISPRRTRCTCFPNITDESEKYIPPRTRRRFGCRFCTYFPFSLNIAKLMPTRFLLPVNCRWTLKNYNYSWTSSSRRFYTHVNLIFEMVSLKTSIPNGVRCDDGWPQGLSYNCFGDKFFFFFLQNLIIRWSIHLKRGGRRGIA